MGSRSLALGLVFLACGSTSPASQDQMRPEAVAPGDLPSDTYRLDLSHFDVGNPARLNNESLVFRPDLGARTKVITSEGEDFRKIYNRLTCGASVSTQSYFPSDGPVLETASKVPVRVESISVEMPDNGSGQVGIPDQRVSEICFAYHTSDGEWHGHFDPIPTVHDEISSSSRVTLQVQADNVDLVGLVIYTGYVSSISFVAR